MGRPAVLRSFSSVVRQMGQARSKVGPALALLLLLLEGPVLLPLAGRAAAAAAPPPVLPAESAAACCPAACTALRGVLQRSKRAREEEAPWKCGHRPERALAVSQLLPDLFSCE